MNTIERMDRSPYMSAVITDCLGSYTLGPTRDWVLDIQIEQFRQAHISYHKQQGDICPKKWQVEKIADTSKFFPPFP